MKIYFYKTEEYNGVLFCEGKRAKDMDCFSTDGYLDGVVDLYADNTVEELKKYFTKNAYYLNAFEDMPGDEFELDPDEDLDEIYDELVYLFTDD